MGTLNDYVEELDRRLGPLNAIAPKVSIIVTNYNYGNYICECLGSVTQQKYPNIECIVVDDCSSDDSLAKISRFIDNNDTHVSFRLVRHGATLGQYAGFRTGLEDADGAFVTFLDADDLLLANFVGEHVHAHLTLPPVAFTSSNQYQIDSFGQMIAGVHPDLLTQNSYRLIGTLSLQTPFWVWATTSSMMFRRAVLNYVLADTGEAFRKCADNYVAHFCNLLGGSILIPTVLGCYRRHQHNTFSNNPLIGGHLPTGDMRHHPAHRLVLQLIRARLFERSESFIALLGLAGFIHTLGKVTRCRDLWRYGMDLALSEGRGIAAAKFYSSWALLHCRRALRRAKNRHPAFTVADLDQGKRATKVASYAEYQRHRRDAK